MLEKPATQENPATTQEILVGKIAPMNIHRRIKEKREELGLTMQALAALVGVKAWQTVQQWEKEDGGTAPKRERLKAVADALKTTPEYLLFGDSRPPEQVDSAAVGNESSKPYLPKDPIPLQYSANATNFRRVCVVGRAQGGLPERLWTDGDYPVGATDEYAELATIDPHAFLTPVVGTSMVPRFNPGEFAFVEPGTEPEPGDDVLVRLITGETLLKKLTGRRGGAVELYSYNEREQGPMFFKDMEISWMYYVGHPVPARKIKTRM
jgi:phage repressor protein C with HTH and peptisase S24 domain